MDNTAPIPSAPIAVSYQPVGVPTAVQPKSKGMTQAVIGIFCAVIALLFFPPLFGVIGIILGIMAVHKGEKTLGVTAIVMAAIFMLIGMVLSYYVNTHPEILRSSTSMSGAVIQSLQ